jgi:hypothetical protein
LNLKAKETIFIIKIGFDQLAYIIWILGLLRIKYNNDVVQTQALKLHGVRNTWLSKLEAKW